MSTDQLDQLTALVAIVSFSAASFGLGWLRGRRYGRDEGWVDCMLRTAKADRERRDARGRFRKREVRS